MGEALKPLRDDGVLVLASGGITHNLGRVFGQGEMPAEDAPEIAESAEFRQWMLEKSAARDWDLRGRYEPIPTHSLPSGYFSCFQIGASALSCSIAILQASNASPRIRAISAWT